VPFTVNAGATGIIRINPASAGGVGIGLPEMGAAALTNPVSRLHVRTGDAVTAAVTNTLTLDHAIPGAAVGADGIGTGLLLRAENSGGVIENAAQINGSLTTALAGSEAGALAFLTRSGALGLTEKLRVDSSGNVGISAIMPTSRLMVQGAGATSATSGLNVTDAASASTLFVRDDGLIGISTANPQFKLHVQGGAGSAGDILVVSTGASNMFRVNGLGEVRAARYFGDGSQLTGITAAAGAASAIFSSTDAVVAADTDANGSGSIFLRTAASDRLTILNNGNVGIGTTGPTNPLSVAGNANVTGTLTAGTFSGSGASLSGLPWAGLTGFPAACPAGNFVSSIGTTLTCSPPPTAPSGAATDEIILRGSSSNGSVGNRVKVYGTVVVNNGSAMTYTSDSVNGDRITINVVGVYAISLLTNASGFDFLGISINGAPTTQLTLLAPVNRLAVATTQGGSQPATVSWTGTLHASDVLRSHQDGATAGNSNFHMFSIARIR
jgi:hypothetical protein